LNTSPLLAAPGSYGLQATDSSYAFLFNADIRVGAGALPVLLDHLQRHAEVGIAEPRCYIDDAQQWYQPAFEPLTPAQVVSVALARVSRHWARRNERRATFRREAARLFLSAAEPQPTRDAKSAAWAAPPRVVSRKL
jgi:GT2 family glycosyltransferase